MAEAIGPGSQLLCIKSCACPGCGESVTSGSIYLCDSVEESSFVARILYGLCQCGEEHLFISVEGKDHIYCPTLFLPLGDPTTVIKETEEPKVKAPQPKQPLTLAEWAESEFPRRIEEWRKNV